VANGISAEQWLAEWFRADYDEQYLAIHGGRSHAYDVVD